MKDIILKHLNELGSTLKESYGNKLILLDEKDFTEFAETLVKKLILPDVMPCFEFSNKATKYTENGVTMLAVDTDGIALTNDNLPHQAYTLEEGIKYTIKLYKA